MKNIYKRGTNYQLRVVIPDYATIFFPQKKLLIRSLQTSQKNVATKFSKILLDKFNYIIQSIKMNIDKNTIKQLVNDFLSTRLEDTERDLYNCPNPQQTMFYMMIDSHIEKYQIAYNTKNYSAIKNDIENIVSNLKSVDKEDIENISKSLLEIQINHLKTIRTKIENNEYSKPNPNILVQQSMPSNIIASKQTLEKTFDEFIANTSITMKWTKDTTQLAETVKKVMTLFFGVSKDISLIKRTELLNFRNMLFNLQPKFLQKNHLKNQSLDFIIEDSKDKPKLSEETINKYMIRVNQFFTYCTENDYIQKSPSANLKVKKDKISVEKKRESYSIEEIYCLQTELEQHTDEVKMIVNLAMYQGMRLNEICQLRKKDIKQIDSIWCIDINIEDDKKVKTRNSIRTIPVHPNILKQFLNYMEDKQNNLFTYTSKKFSEFYRKNINNIITNNDKKTLYSLRHNFIDSLIQNNVRTEIVASLAGHAQQYSITMNVYGNRVNVQILKDAIEKVQY